MGIQNGVASMPENRMEVPQKIKNRILLLGIDPKELKSRSQKRLSALPSLSQHYLQLRCENNLNVH